MNSKPVKVGRKRERRFCCRFSWVLTAVVFEARLLHLPFKKTGTGMACKGRYHLLYQNWRHAFTEAASTARLPKINRTRNCNWLRVCHNISCIFANLLVCCISTIAVPLHQLYHLLHCRAGMFRIFQSLSGGYDHYSTMLFTAVRPCQGKLNTSKEENCRFLSQSAISDHHHSLSSVIDVSLGCNFHLLCSFI
jgi:hypothetical protein